MDFEVEQATIEIQNFETIVQHFPVNNETFIKSNIDYKNIADDIREAE